MDSRAIFFWHLLILTTARNIPTNPPHIIFILADDLGWNDVSFHGSDQIPTPNIDALAYNGVILNNHYALPLCTPSRAALLTGKYPIHNGMQHNLILEPEPWGLPLDERLLPQYLDELGYTSHAIGKWHLGYFKKEYTPTHRGFTSHYGFWNGYQGYYNHFVQASFLPYEGYDMRRNMSVDWESFGRYSTDLFTDEAVRLIDEHDTEKGPLFLYLAHLAPHAGTYDAPLEAPAETIAQFRHIQDPSRRVYAAMVSKLDESVGLVVSALHKKGILDNSIIVFTSDNGAPTIGIHPNHGSNWPLRGMKNTPWDGGTRTVTCVWSRHLERPRRVSHQLMHISDWVPTLYSAAGGDVTKLKHLDGVDMWEAISRNLPSPRKQLLINLDEATGYASMRIGDFKFVNGTTMLGYLDHWTGTPSEENENDISPQHEQLYRSQVLNSRVSRAINGAVTSAAPQVAALRAAAKIHCGSHSHQEAPCDPLKRPCIYHMPSNACERGPSLEDARLMTMFKEAVEKYRSAAVPPVNQRTDRLANPKYWNNTWTNWRDFPSPTSETHEKGRGGFFF